MADENILLNSDLESRYEKYKGIIKNFTLMSDIIYLCETCSRKENVWNMFCRSLWRNKIYT